MSPRSCSCFATRALSFFATALISSTGCGPQSALNESADDTVNLDLIEGVAVQGMGGKCLDVINNGWTAGTGVNMWDCHGGNNQRWSLPSLNQTGPIKASNGLCLDVWGSGTADGTPVKLYPCHGKANQRWSRTSAKRLVGLGGKCLDVRASGTANGTAVQLYTCNGTAAQEWTTASTVLSPSAPAPSQQETPTPVPSPTALPQGDLPGWKQVLAEDFNSAAATGDEFLSTYSKSWCAYTDTSKYKRANVSARDGMMVVNLPGDAGAAGVWAPGGCATAWTGMLYGRFAFRFKAVNAQGQGTATMLWPSSDIWGDGEIDYPEGNFEGSIHVFHHGVGCTNCSSADGTDTKASFQDWHIAAIEWSASKVDYFLDGQRVKTVTHDVPTTRHRFTIQIAPTSATPKPGQFLVDWVAIYQRQ